MHGFFRRQRASTVVIRMVAFEVFVQRGTTASIAYLVGLPAYITCLAREHVCMCGHLAHYPPEQVPAELAIDAVWFIGFLTAGVAGLLRGPRRMRWLGASSVVLLGTRAGLASGGGYCVVFPELPLLLMAGWLAVSQLLRSRAPASSPDAAPRNSS